MKPPDHETWLAFWITWNTVDPPISEIGNEFEIIDMLGKTHKLTINQVKANVFDEISGVIPDEAATIAKMVTMTRSLISESDPLNEYLDKLENLVRLMLNYKK